MKKIILFLIASSSIYGLNVSTNPLGVGLMVGQPMAVTAKYWLSKEQAIDGGIGVSIGSGNSLHLHSDYLFHRFDWLVPQSGQIPVHFGAGLRIKIADEESTKVKNRKTRFGFRFPVGASYLFDDFETFPFDLFSELAPVIDLAPKVYIDFNFAVGARHYF